MPFCSSVTSWFKSTPAKKVDKEEVVSTMRAVHPLPLTVLRSLIFATFVNYSSRKAKERTIYSDITLSKL